VCVGGYHLDFVEKALLKRIYNSSDQKHIRC
jgi:hypothetical protein